MKVAAAKNANLPLGRHNAKVVDADKDGIEFELLECDQRGVRLLFKAPKSISPTSRFGKAIGHLQGYGPLPDEQLDLSKLIGKTCSVHVDLVEGEKIIIGVSEMLHGKK